ncbi:MAG TPA: magnesium/cobalt transporter CorA [bacterium]|nr:magnesium/cobalt transporter CorA [bacterium]
MRNRLFYPKSRKAGLPPGSLVYTGEARQEKPRLTLIRYSESKFEERTIDPADEMMLPPKASGITWLNVDGLHQVDLIEKIGQLYPIHPLIQEDILHIDQRPKLEDMGDYLYLVMKMISVDPATRAIEAEQVSVILRQDVVISFQEKAGDVFGGVRERIRKNRGRIRKMQADYLAYALLDALVDQYFLVLESVGEDIEAIEDEVMTRPTPEALQRLYHIKRHLLFLRKSAWPVREMIGALERSETTFVRPQTRPFLRDLYDHVIQIIDMVETQRDMNAGMFDIYLSSVGNRTNEVMKVLTIIATIFIPLTFIAGVYGMNFEFMPELGWRWGYFGVLGVMAGMVFSMLYFFRRRKWL